MLTVLLIIHFTFHLKLQSIIYPVYAFKPIFLWAIVVFIIRLSTLCPDAAHGFRTAVQCVADL